MRTSLRGLRRLVHDAVHACTRMVEDVEEQAAQKVVDLVSVVEPVAPAAKLVNDVRRVVTKLSVHSVLGVNLLVDVVGEVGLGVVDRLQPESDTPVSLVPMTSDTSSAAWLEDACLGALNGLVGDHLHRMGNDLDLGMQLRLHDAYVEPATVAASKVVVLAHGVCATEWCFCMPAGAPLDDDAAHFGALLQRDFGFTPVFLRYNSGRHISDNGRLLASLLDDIDCDEMVLLGHSMGGLVMRSALHQGRQEGRAFVDKVTHLVCMGSPHQGAPLEKAGHVLTSTLRRFSSPGAQIPARLLDARSDGIKDLRHGFLVEDDWQHPTADRVLDVQRTDLGYEPHITYAFIAGNAASDADHPAGALLGDLIVRRGSARGPAAVDVDAQTFDIHVSDVDGVLHFHMQSHPAVYEVVRRLLDA